MTTANQSEVEESKIPFTGKTYQKQILRTNSNSGFINIVEWLPWPSFGSECFGYVQEKVNMKGLEKVLKTVD